MTKTVKVIGIIGTALCVTTADGQKTFDVIVQALSDAENQTDLPIEVSFEGAELVITAFLNAAVGQFYNNRTREEVKRLVQFTHLDPDDEAMLECVIDNAIKYYRNPQVFDAAVKEVFEYA